jgi:hypothetical protein
LVSVAEAEADATDVEAVFLVADATDEEAAFLVAEAFFFDFLPGTWYVAFTNIESFSIKGSIELVRVLFDHQIKP